MRNLFMLTSNVVLRGGVIFLFLLCLNLTWADDDMQVVTDGQIQATTATIPGLYANTICSSGTEHLLLGTDVDWSFIKLCEDITVEDSFSQLFISEGSSAWPPLRFGYYDENGNLHNIRAGIRRSSGTLVLQGNSDSNEGLGEVKLLTGPDNNQNGLVVDRQGNVGIGIETPTEKLDVQGKVKADEFIGTATVALQANSALNAEKIEGHSYGDLEIAFAPSEHHHDADYALSSHNHVAGDLPALGSMSGSVTDSQVPDDITIDSASNADYASNANNLDGHDWSYFATASHNHSTLNMQQIKDTGGDAIINIDAGTNNVGIGGGAVSDRKLKVTGSFQATGDVYGLDLHVNGISTDGSDEEVNIDANLTVEESLVADTINVSNGLFETQANNNKVIVDGNAEFNSGYTKFNGSYTYVNRNGLVFQGRYLSTDPAPWTGHAMLFGQYDYDNYPIYTKIFALDDSGYYTCLSPHSFVNYQPDESDPLPWTYYSRNLFIGREVNADISGALRALEKLTSQTFLYYEDLPESERIDVETWKTSETLRIQQEAREEYLKANPWVEISLEKAMEEKPVLAEVKVEEVVTRYRINKETRKVESYRTTETLTRKVETKATEWRLKEGVRFDEKTGKCFRPRKPEEVPAEILEVPEITLPAHVRDRLPAAQKKEEPTDISAR